MVTETQLDYLESHYFSAYFHQDWPIEFERATDVVQHFLHVAEPEEIENVQNLIWLLLQEIKNDDTLADIVWHQLDCNYDPSVDDKTLRGWLSETANLMAAWTKQLTDNDLTLLLNRSIAPKVAHTIKEHVAKNDVELHQRLSLVRFPYRGGLSAFSTLTLAEESIAFIIKEHNVAIQQLLPRIPEGQQFPPFVSDLAKPLGILVTTTGLSDVNVTAARLLLIRDSRSSSGYSILCSYPVILLNDRATWLSKDDTSVLAELFGGYFYQLWDTVYSHPNLAIIDYLRDRPHDVIVKLVETIKNGLFSIQDDKTLTEVLVYELGCEYEPQILGQSTRAWLSSVVMLLERWLLTMYV